MNKCCFLKSLESWKNLPVLDVLEQLAYRIWVCYMVGGLFYHRAAPITAFTFFFPRYKKRSYLQDSAAGIIWLVFPNPLFHSSINTVSGAQSHKYVWCSCWLLKYFKYAEERHWGTGGQSRGMCTKNNLYIISSVNRQFSIITLKMYTLGEADCTWSYCAEQASCYTPPASCTHM